MANNTNVQAVKVANEQIRPLADAMAQLYDRAKGIGQLAVANNWNGTLFATDADTLIDGAATDGRGIVTNGQLKIILSLAAAFVTDFETSSNLKLNQTLQVAVNTKQR